MAGPWWPGVVADDLEPGTGRAEPSLEEERDIVLWHQDETLRLYGQALGNKTFRKHLGWTLSRLELRGALDGEAHASLRATLLSDKDNSRVARGIRDTYARILGEEEAA